MNVGRERVGVGALELGEQAPVENCSRQLMALGGKLFQRARIRAPGASLGAPAAGETHLVEQDLAELLRRADIEVLPGKLPDLVFEPSEALCEGAGESGKRRALDPNSCLQYYREH